MEHFDALCRLQVMKGGTTWLGIFGFLVIALLMVREVKGAMVWGILLVASLSWFRSTGVR